MAPDEVGRARWGAWAPPTALIVVLTIAWELVSRLGLVSTFLLPSPSAIVAQLVVAAGLPPPQLQLDGSDMGFQSTFTSPPG